MAHRRIHGFEGYFSADVSAVFTVQSGTTQITTSGPRTGLRCMLINNGYAEETFDNQATWIVGGAFAPQALSATHPIIALVDAGTVQIHVDIHTDGSIKAYRGTGTGNLLGTSTGVTLSVATYYYIEVKATIHDSTGSIEVLVNGITRLLLTGIDTKVTANAYANAVRLAAAGSGGVLIDDVYINDGSGAEDNDFWGDVKVYPVLPTSDSAAGNSWTPSTGSDKFATVDEAAQNGDTDYISSTTPGDRQLFGFAPFAGLGAIKAVQLSAFVRKDDGATREVKLTARPGSTNHDGAVQAVPSSYARKAESWTKDPDTAAAWVQSDLNASEFGVKHET